MRMITAVILAATVLCEPAVAFEFTARSFGPIFDERVRMSHVHVTDFCSDWDHDGGSCEYGIDKPLDAWVVDSPAAGKRAYAVTLSWVGKNEYEQRKDAALAISEICQPQISAQDRASLLDRISPKKQDDGSYLGGGVEIIADVKYEFKADRPGLVSLWLTDLTVPNGLGSDPNSPIADPSR